MTPYSGPGRRAGLTLTEVLVALFVAALGLISLFTLFPLGALQLGQALRDDRCAQVAGQADAYLRQYWQAKVVGPTQTPTPDTPPLGAEDVILVGNPSATPAKVSTFVNPTNDSANSTSNGTGFPDATVGPGYPLFWDPIGFIANGGPGSPPALAVASASGGTFPRRAPWLKTMMPNMSVPLMTTTQQALQVCSLTDDLNFTPAGTPDTTPGSPPVVSRQGRYNWSAILQPSDISAATVADLKVLVFENRPPGFVAPGAEVYLATNINPAAMPTAGVVNPSTTTTSADGDRSIVFTLPTPTDPNAPALVRKGGWLMDGTIQKVADAGANYPLRNANFYRIVGVTPDGTTPYKYTVDIDPPIRARPDGKTGSYAPTLYFLAALAEVFDRPPLKDNNIYLAGNGLVP